MSPRSVRTNEQMRLQSQERILVSAVEVFADRGFHNATISEITARAGVSRGLITYYFPTKHDLARKALARYLEWLLTLVDVAGTAAERLGAIIDGILATTASSLPEQRMVLSLMIHPSTHPLFAEVEFDEHERLTLFEDALRGLFAERDAANPALEEVMFRSIMEGVIFKASVYRDEYPLEQVRLRIHQMYDLPVPLNTLIQSRSEPVGRMRAKSSKEPDPVRRTVGSH